MIRFLLLSLPIYIVAERCQADAERVSAAIVLSSVVIVVGVPFVAWLMMDT
jgi:predicted permease